MWPRYDKSWTGDPLRKGNKLNGLIRVNSKLTIITTRKELLSESTVKCEVLSRKPGDLAAKKLSDLLIF